MAAISYSFCMSMLHSFWQAGLLLVGYYLLRQIFLKNSQPTQKRNLLFVLVVVQFILFAFTFGYYLYNNADVSGSMITSTFISTTTTGIHYVAPWLMAVYCVILGCRFLQVILSWRNIAHTFNKDLQKPLLDYKLFCKEKALQFGIKRPVKIWLSHYITTPLTYGFFKPVILLPVALVNQLSVKQVEAVIVHELGHIKSNDYLLNCFLIFFENIFFLNPFTRIICNMIKLEREKACDLQVIEFNYNPVLYAEALLQIQKNEQWVASSMQPAFVQLAATGSKNHLLNRIKYFTNKNLKVNYSSRQGHLLKAAFSFIFLIGMVILLSLPAIFINSPASFVVQNMLPLFKTDLLTVPNPAPKMQKENTASFIETKPVIAGNNKTSKAIVKKEKTATTIAKASNKNKSELLTPNDTKMEIIPVAYSEKKQEQQQIIIKEEVSGSNEVVVKVYTAINHNGEWVILPDMIAATNIKIDSCGKILTDSTLIKQSVQQ